MIPAQQSARLGTSPDAVLHAARAARRMNRDAMLASAVAIFTNPKRRKITANGKTVETWWDPQSRSYVTQLKDAEQNQVGDAEYSGNAQSAAFAHLTALFQLLDE